jgi:hypothetical protein
MMININIPVNFLYGLDILKFLKSLWLLHPSSKIIKIRKNVNLCKHVCLSMLQITPAVLSRFQKLGIELESTLFEIHTYQYDK